MCFAIQEQGFARWNWDSEWSRRVRESWAGTGGNLVRANAEEGFGNSQLWGIHSGE